MLLHVIEGINRTFELKKVLEACMEATQIVMNAEASSLMLLDEKTGELNVSIPTGPVKEEITGTVIPKDKGIGGWVLSYNKPFISNDVSESDIFWKDLSTDFITRNIICVPLRDTERNIFGVLQAINKKKNKSFTDSDLQVLESLALHVSTAIERSRKYEEMVRKLEDREVEISEIHHRLKNNLSTICALLEFDLSDLKDPKSRRALASTNSRLKSVAEAHSLLYEQKQMASVELSEYLRSVIQNVERIFEEPEKDINVQVRFDTIELDANRAMLCGLMVNELLINAYKHAFVDRDTGEIVVNLKKTPNNKIAVIVTDNGIGIGPTGDSEESLKPNGHFILRALSKKLKADLSFDENPDIGTAIIFSFRA
ncbi:histidine kinase dimerization/phosphoacceptor domain -containing protein [Gracilimonas sp.]|uniref:histidine kinase dimerization/phosphoacceptor domain -containing protein n=1 Tax=Gracilimonas sp. TaxID=1974203 RepID=UPI0025C032B7|nr:histidine kinase dimerization/phosphoacceptor domain -containing protein [Gracilimonas sp.]